MAGGGIKVSNVKIIGGADGLTPVFKIEEGILFNSYDNGKNWNKIGQVQGVNGKNGEDGSKLISQVLQGQDENGGNVYLQTYSDGSTFVFVAPKGNEGDKADLTLYQKKEDDGLITIRKNIVEAINEVNSLGGYALRLVSETQEEIGNIEALETESKEIVGAINEVNAKAEQGADIDLSEYVKFTDTIGNNKLGVIRFLDGYGLQRINDYLLVKDANNQEINENLQRKPITAKNLDYAIVKGLTNNATTMTEEQKALAQAWLGVKSLYNHHISFKFTQGDKTYNCNLEYSSNSNVAFETVGQFYSVAKNSGCVGLAYVDNNSTDCFLITMWEIGYLGEGYTLCFGSAMGAQYSGFSMYMGDVSGISSITNFNDTVL